METITTHLSYGRKETEKGKIPQKRNGNYLEREEFRDVDDDARSCRNRKKAFRHRYL